MLQFHLYPLCLPLSKLIFFELSSIELQAWTEQLSSARPVAVISSFIMPTHRSLSLFDFSFTCWLLCFGLSQRYLSHRGLLCIPTQISTRQLWVLTQSFPLNEALTTSHLAHGHDLPLVLQTRTLYKRQNIYTKCSQSVSVLGNATFTILVSQDTLQNH